MGAAYLAGLAVGFWEDFSTIQSIWQLDRTYHPDRSEEERKKLIAGWSKAVERQKPGRNRNKTEGLCLRPFCFVFGFSSAEPPIQR